MKILILSCYFIIFGIIALTNYSIDIKNADIRLNALLNYLACHAIGYNDNHTCHEEYDRLRSHLLPELSSATYILLALVPWSNLLFAVQVTDIKSMMRKVVYYYSSHSSQDKTLSSNSTTSYNQQHN